MDRIARLTPTLRLFGGFEVCEAGKPGGWIHIQPKPSAVLAYLALATPRLQRRDTLLATFWPDLDAQHARGALSKALHHLRRALGESVLETLGDQEVGIAAGALRVDVLAFQQSIAAGRFADALDEYQGELLAGFHCADSPGFEHWLDHERARLSRAALEAARALAETALVADHVTDALRWSRRATDIGPHDEAAVRLLMRALARDGSHAEAVKAYQSLRGRLVSELDVEPSAETQTLFTSLRLAQSAVDRRSSAKDGAVIERPGNDVGTPVAAGTPKSRERDPKRRSWERLRPALGVGLAVAAVVVLRSSDATETGAGTPKTGPLPYSVAVLPFTQRGATPGEGYLAYGVTEEVTNTLARDPSLLVSAALATSTASRSTSSLQEISQQLGVSKILSGDIERTHDALRILMQLTEASSGRLLWRHTYQVAERELPTVYADAARRVHAAVSPVTAPTLVATPPVTVKSASQEAYRSYLLGEYALQKRTAAGTRDAIVHFHDATQRDPSYAAAFAALANGYALRAIYREGSTRDERIAGVAQAAARALALDSASAVAWTALGISRFLDLWDWRGSDSAFRRAHDLNPNLVSAYVFHAQLLVAVGRKREGEAALERMHVLDPVSSGANATYGLVLYHLRRYDEAVQVLRSVVQGDSAYENGLSFLTRPLLILGRERELADVLQRHLALRGRPAADEAAIVARAAVDPGRVGDAKRILDGWEAAGPSFLGPVQIARLRARLGDHDGALRSLASALAARSPGLYGVAVDPAFDPLHLEPRFRAILRAMGLESPVAR